MKKAVKIITIVYTGLAIIAIIFYCIMLFKGAVWESLLSIVSLMVNFILLLALYGALDRLDFLEEKVSKIDDMQQTLKSKLIEKDNQTDKK